VIHTVVKSVELLVSQPLSLIFGTTKTQPLIIFVGNLYLGSVTKACLK